MTLRSVFRAFEVVNYTFYWETFCLLPVVVRIGKACFASVLCSCKVD
jgi:hypothetical protein